MGIERATLDQIRADIAHAFHLAKRFEERREDTRALVKLDAAESRVAAFLEQVKAEPKGGEMAMLPDSPRLTNEARDKQIAEQFKCGRGACSNLPLTHYNTGIDLLYCRACARAINLHNPGLCIPYTRPK